MLPDDTLLQLHTFREALRDFLGVTSLSRQITTIEQKVTIMDVSQQDIVDLVSAETADLATFGATLSNVFADVDALITLAKAGQTNSPDFTALANSIAFNRTAIANMAAQASTENTSAQAVINPPAPPVPVALALSSLPSLAIGATGLVTVSTRIPASDNPVFSSSDSTVATVDSTGTVTGIAAGTAFITISTDTLGSASTTVVVS